MSVFKSIKSLFFGTYTRMFITSYLIFLFVGAGLLFLPWSIQEGIDLSFVDAIFVSASALSTTGLSTVTVSETFSVFGQIMLLLIIQVGGIGLIMMIALFWLLMRKKIGFSQRTLIMTDQNQLTRQGIVKFIRDVLIVVFTIEIIAFLILGFYFYFSGYFNLSTSILQSVFLTVSFFTNAGFDISPSGSSLSMFENDYVVQVTGMVLIFMGAVGFWLLVELKAFIKAKLKKETFKFSLFVKTLFVLHLTIWIVSAIVFYLIERDGYLDSMSLGKMIYHTLFMSLTPRNAGFSLFDISELKESTHLVYIFLMFLGSSPNSAGGGIRTTTLFLALLGVRAFSRGYDDVVFRERTIKKETVHKALITVFMALVFVFSVVLLMSILGSHEIKYYAFEVISAFGTTGLSLGVTSGLNVVSKILLIITMFVGRVGILATLLLFKPKTKKHSTISYPETDFIVG